MKRFALSFFLFFTLLIAGSVLLDQDPPAASPHASASTSGPADQATLQRDSEMTQQMSVVGTNGPMQRPGTHDPQLTHSQDPTFVRQLEQYQHQVDRMLARATP